MSNVGLGPFQESPIWSQRHASPATVTGRPIGAENIPLMPDRNDIVYVTLPWEGERKHVSPCAVF